MDSPDFYPRWFRYAVAISVACTILLIGVGIFVAIHFLGKVW